MGSRGLPERFTQGGFADKISNTWQKVQLAIEKVANVSHEEEAKPLYETVWRYVFPNLDVR